MHVWTINDDPGTAQPKVLVYTSQKDAAQAQKNYRDNLKYYQALHKDNPPDGSVNAIEYEGFCPIPSLTIRALSAAIIP